MEISIPTVAVLMSTYNGEEYLREQLDSIFSQSGVNVKLFVRDDGSSDSTISILKEYEKNFPIVILVDNENVGPGESFMRLVYKYYNEPQVDYFAFADQDDIWIKDKLLVAVNMINKYSGCGPILYSSNQFIYAEGKNEGVRYEKNQKTDLISHMTKNTISGCTFVFDKQLARLIGETDKPDYRVIKYRLHDAWIMLVAISCGKVIYDNNAHMLYRIHRNNVVGIKGVSIIKRLDKLKRFLGKRDDSNLRLITAKELLRLYPQIREKNRRIISLYACYQDSWKDKNRLALNKTIKANCEESPIVFMIKVYTNFI